MGVMAAKQSVMDGSRRENPEHWVTELITPEVLRGTFGCVSVRARSHELTIVAPGRTVSEVTIGHKQVKLTSHCMSFRDMVLESTRITYLKKITWRTNYIPPIYSAWDSCHTSRVLLARNSNPLRL